MKNILLLFAVVLLAASCGSKVEYPYTLSNAEVTNIGDQIIYSGGIEIPTASDELLNYEGNDDYEKDVVIAVEFIDEATLNLTLGNGPFASFLNDSLMNLPYTLVDDLYTATFEFDGDEIEFQFTGDQDEIVVNLASVVDLDKTVTSTSVSTFIGHYNTEVSYLEESIKNTETVDTLVTRTYQIIIN